MATSIWSYWTLETGRPTVDCGLFMASATVWTMTEPDKTVEGSALLVTTMATAMTVAILLQVVFGALAPFLREDLGLSRTQLGSLTTAMYVSAAALSTLAGGVVDRLGARVPLLGLFAIMAGSVALVAAAPGYLLLVVGSLICGIAISIANPVTNRMIQTSITPSRQGLVTGIKQSGIQVGVFAGSAILPIIATQSGWRTAVSACLVAPAAGAAMTVAAVPRRNAPARSRPQGSWGQLPKGTGWLAAYALAMGVGISGVSAYLPLFGVEELALSETTAGLLAAAVGGVAMVARTIWGVVADRVPSALRWALTLMASLTVVAAVLLITASPSALAWVWVATVVIGVSSAAWNGVAMLAVIRQAPAAVAGLASGVVVLGFYAGFATGPVVFGALVDATDNYAVGWSMVAAAAAVATVLSYVWRRAVWGPSAAFLD